MKLIAHTGGVRSCDWSHLTGGLRGKKSSALFSSSEQNERDEVKSAIKVGDGEKGPVSLCSLKSALLGADFCQDGSAGKLIMSVLT